MSIIVLNSSTMFLKRQDFRDKIEALLLNKIDRLKWNYYEVDLNVNPASIERDNIEDFFEKFEENLSDYSYTGDTKTAEEVVRYIFSYLSRDKKILVNVVKRLFDVNEIKNNSGADSGFLGKHNSKEREYRDNEFTAKIRDGFRGDIKNIVILAEGDSWFQFPRVLRRIDGVKDIIDWLMKKENYAVKSLAAGGDWLSNIFNVGEYVEELPKVQPDVFLLSGGGNDMIGSNRIATMVINPHLMKRRQVGDKIMDDLIALRKGNDNIDINRYKNGLSLLSDEFFAFLNISFIQYFTFIDNIMQLPKYRKMLIVTQGYDYGIPYNKSRGNWISLQRFINNKTDTGNWLFEPLNMKGIIDAKDQADVIYTMIYEFNEMLILLCNSNRLPRLFHIDCRGFAKEDDWFDELHLKSEAFKKIADVFIKCIEENLRQEKPKRKNKVYRVVDNAV